MRMVVAYIHEKAFEPIRTELHALGLDSLAITAVNGVAPGTGTTMHYRGAKLVNHLHSVVKLECVAAVEDVATIVDTIQRHAGGYQVGEDRVFIVPVETYPVGRREPAEETLRVDRHSAALA